MALTLSDAEKLAIENNPKFAAARLNAAASTKSRWSSAQDSCQLYRAPLPESVLTQEAAWRLAGGLNNPVVYNRLASGLLVSQLVTDFGRTSSLVASANLRAQAQDQLTETARADILVVTARAYFGVLRATAVLKVAQQTVSARQLLSDQITALFNSQLKSRLDVSFANVNLADAQLLLSQAENDLKSTEAVLAAAIGLPAQTSFSLSEESRPAALPDQVDPFVQQALQDRPELKDLRLEQSAAERFVKAEHALHFQRSPLLEQPGSCRWEKPRPGSLWRHRFEREHPCIQRWTFSCPADRSGVTRQSSHRTGQ